MIILDSTTKSLEVVLGGAVTTNEAVFSASYVDISQTDYGVDAISSNDGTTNSATAVTMLSAPPASTSRQVKYISIYNADTSVIEVEVRVNNNSTFRTLINYNLPVDKTLQYTNDGGWGVVNGDATGNVEAILSDASVENPFADTTNVIGVSNTGGLVKNTWNNIKTFLNNTFAVLTGGNTFSGVQDFTDRIDTNAGISFDGGVNVLSEYEVGTWTPVLGGRFGQSGQEYSKQEGWYIRNGLIVTAGFICNLTTAGTFASAGNANVSGLPFIAQNTNTNHRSFLTGYNYSNIGVNINDMGSVLLSGDDFVRIAWNTSPTNNVELGLASSIWVDGCSMQGTVTYKCQP